VSPDLIGTYEGATTVRGDFVLSPDAPTTLAPGDEVDLGLGVSNNIAGAGSKLMPIVVSLKAGPQFQVLGPSAQTLSLAPMHEGATTFRVRATDALGSGTLAFSAAYGPKSARQSIDVSVRPAAPYRSVLQFARIDPGASMGIQNLRRMYEPYSRRTATISTAPMVLVQGLTSWLANSDNYCSEQIVSMAMPRLLSARWSSLPVIVGSLQSSRPSAGSTSPDPLASEIGILQSRQNEQGGFGLWSATPDSEPFVSAYAMHFLLEARDRGAAVPADVIDAGNKYLNQLADDESLDKLDDLRQRAYAVYLLTRQGNITTNQLAAVQKRLEDAYPKDWKNDLAAAWLATSYKLMKQDQPANALIGGLQRRLERNTDEGGWAYDDYDDPLITDSTVLYLLARHFPDRARTLSPRALENIARPLERDEYNTLSAAMTMLALDAYAESNAPSLDTLQIDAFDAKNRATVIGHIQNALLQAGIFSGSATHLRASNGSGVAAWLAVEQTGFDRTAPANALRHGLEIVREYTDVHGHPLSTVTLGEDVDVHLKIRATGNAGVGDVVIVDLLPGGFDPVLNPPPEPSDSQNNGSAASNPGDSIRTAGTTFNPAYTDIREDRVVIYGSASPDVEEYVYRIRASNSGRFLVPPAFGESMYDRRVQAQSPGGGTITVVRPHA